MHNERSTSSILKYGLQPEAGGSVSPQRPQSQDHPSLTCLQTLMCRAGRKHCDGRRALGWGQVTHLGLPPGCPCAPAYVDLRPVHRPWGQTVTTTHAASILQARPVQRRGRGENRHCPQRSGDEGDTGDEDRRVQGQQRERHARRVREGMRRCREQVGKARHRAAGSWRGSLNGRQVWAGPRASCREGQPPSVGSRDAAV